MDEFEGFETKAFVGRLLGKGDWTGFMDKIKVGAKQLLLALYRCLYCMHVLHFRRQHPDLQLGHCMQAADACCGNMYMLWSYVSRVNACTHAGHNKHMVLLTSRTYPYHTILALL